MKGKKSSNMPWMVCLRIGKDVVGGSRHFPSYEQADKVRQKMLVSPSVRAQSNIGVLVMHFKKFQELCSKGDACTIARIKANEMAMPELAKLSTTAHVVDEIDVEQMQAWKDHCRAHLT